MAQNGDEMERDSEEVFGEEELQAFEELCDHFSCDFTDEEWASPYLCSAHPHSWLAGLHADLAHMKPQSSSAASVKVRRGLVISEPQREQQERRVKKLISHCMQSVEKTEEFLAQCLPDEPADLDNEVDDEPQRTDSHPIRTSDADASAAKARKADAKLQAFRSVSAREWT